MIIKGRKIFIDTIDFLEQQAKKINDSIYSGSVVTIQGLVLLISGINLPVGSLCFIKKRKKIIFIEKFLK